MLTMHMEARETARKVAKNSTWVNGLLLLLGDTSDQDAEVFFFIVEFTFNVFIEFG